MNKYGPFGPDYDARLERERMNIIRAQDRIRLSSNGDPGIVDICNHQIEKAKLEYQRILAEKMAYDVAHNIK